MQISGPYPPGPQPVLAWSVSQPAIAAGRNCAVAPDGPGLRARYFSGKNWDGELRRERVEDWPVHWITTEEATRFGSIEWSGWLRLPISGEYSFQFLTGGMRGSASVGEQLHIDPEANASARFDEGRYPVRLRCQTGPGALCWLRWAPPGGDFDAIPSELFSPGPTIGDDMALIPMERHSEPFAGVPVTRSRPSALAWRSTGLTSVPSLIHAGGADAVTFFTHTRNHNGGRVAQILERFARHDSMGMVVAHHSTPGFAGDSVFALAGSTAPVGARPFLSVASAEIKLADSSGRPYRRVTHAPPLPVVG